MSQPAGLYLIVEATPGGAALDRVKAALDAAAIASALVTAAPGVKLDAALARPLVELIQSKGAAALIDDDAALARALRADGVHVRPGDRFDVRLAEAREIMGTRYIVGAEADTRHDAMTAGEAGTEYVAFAGHVMDELVPWWAEIFEIPCVAFGTHDIATATAMADCGADFIAFSLDAGGTAADAADRTRAMAAAVTSAPDQHPAT